MRSSPTRETVCFDAHGAPLLPMGAFPARDAGGVAIGRGAYACVVHKELPLGSVAIKQIERRADTVQQHCGELLAEGLRHPALVTVLSIVWTRHELLVIMQFAGSCTFLDLLHGRLTGSRALSTLAAVSAAVLFLHERLLVHQDIKPDNILWHAGEQRARLGDFGCMRLKGTRTHVCGAVQWRAPELAGGEAHVALPALDAWSLGMLLALAGEQTTAPKWSSLPDLLRSSAKALLQNEPSRRDVLSSTQSLRRAHSVWNDCGEEKSRPLNPLLSRAEILGPGSTVSPARWLPYAALL